MPRMRMEMCKWSVGQLAVRFSRFDHSSFLHTEPNLTSAIRQIRIVSRSIWKRRIL